MSLLSRSGRSRRAGLAAIAGLTARPSRPELRALRVCADPNNLPFSNARAEGSRIGSRRSWPATSARPFEYIWWAERRGFIRKTLGAGSLRRGHGNSGRQRPGPRDSALLRIVLRLPHPRERTSAYRVARRSALRRLRIGVHLIGEDYNNPPPVQALARRGSCGMSWGTASTGTTLGPIHRPTWCTPSPRGEVDVAIIWGPFAGISARAKRCRCAMRRCSRPWIRRASLHLRHRARCSARRFRAPRAARRGARAARREIGGSSTHTTSQVDGVARGACRAAEGIVRIAPSACSSSPAGSGACDRSRRSDRPGGCARRRDPRPRRAPALAPGHRAAGGAR